MLGRLLEAGLGVAVDRVDAFYWYSRAEARGVSTLADRRKLIGAMSEAEMAAAKRKVDEARRQGLVK